MAWSISLLWLDEKAERAPVYTAIRFTPPYPAVRLGVAITSEPPSAPSQIIGKRRGCIQAQRLNGRLASGGSF
jgi:hypothetical protein